MIDASAINIWPLDSDLIDFDYAAIMPMQLPLLWMQQMCTFVGGGMGEFYITRHVKQGEVLRRG